MFVLIHVSLVCISLFFYFIEYTRIRNNVVCVYIHALLSANIQMYTLKYIYCMYIKRICMYIRTFIYVHDAGMYPK